MLRRSFSPAARLSGSRAKSEERLPYVRREHLCVHVYKVCSALDPDKVRSEGAVQSVYYKY